MTDTNIKNAGQTINGITIYGNVEKWEQNGKKTIVLFENGTTVAYPNRKNDAGTISVKTNDKGFSEIDMFNCNNVEIAGAPKMSNDLYLKDCKKCKVDISEDYGLDKVVLDYESGNLVSKKSNMIKYSNGDTIGTEVRVNLEKNKQLYHYQTFKMAGEGVVKEKEISN